MTVSRGEERSERSERAALSGLLSAISLFDICQFLMLNRKTGTLTVRSGSRSAYVTFKDGQLMNAMDDSLRDGEAVLLQAVQWTEGQFEFEPGPVPPEQRIHASTESILLEAARQLDEMRARDQLDEGGLGLRPSREEAFRATQERAASLSEAFRRAVTEEQSLPVSPDWRRTLLHRLASGELERILVGPEGKVRAVGSGGVTWLEGPTAREIEAWAEELSIRPGKDSLAESGATPIAARFPSTTSRLVRVEDGHRLWVARNASPEGDWISLCRPRPILPQWEDLGLTTSLLGSLQQVQGRAILLIAPSPALASAAVAAWVHARGLVHPEVGWVIEAWPRFDWEGAPGRISSLPPGSLPRVGDLSALRDVSGAGLIVLHNVRTGRLLREALDLATEGTSVLLSMPGGTPDRAIEILASRVNHRGQLRLRESIAQQIGGVWSVRTSANSTGVPWQSHFVPGPNISPRSAAA